MYSFISDYEGREIHAIHIHRKSQRSMYPPKVVKKPTFWQITQNSPTIFQFGLREMETPNFTANCMKSTQFTSPHSESHKISTIHTNF